MKKLCFLLMAGVFFGCQSSTPVPDVTSEETAATKAVRNSINIGDQTFQIEIADTEIERQIGLMGRDYLAPDHGMLFVFEQAGSHAFWMKNTLIPLDVIWISDDFKVVDIQTLMPCPPETLDCPVSAPQGPAKYVLEVNGSAFSGSISDDATLFLSE